MGFGTSGKLSCVVMISSAQALGRYSAYGIFFTLLISYIAILPMQRSKVYPMSNPSLYSKDNASATSSRHNDIGAICFMPNINIYLNKYMLSYIQIHWHMP